MSNPHAFRSFVVLAEMRTGSNLLETCLNSFDGISCHGEVFNPHFLAYPKAEELFGFDKAARDADPIAVLESFSHQPELAGFRFFHDHDSRVFEPIMRDRSCAKIILTRNPLESYVSLQIARETQQWRLGDVTQRKTAKVVFDPAEFAEHVNLLQDFQLRVQKLLQSTGQTGFYLSYEDILDLNVLNGLVDWLGLESRIDALPRRLKRQNPEPLEDKLVNPEAVADGLARIDRFNLTRTPSFEPRHASMVWAFQACRNVPLVYAPLPGSPERAIFKWMAAIDGSGQRDLRSDFTPQTWRAWLHDNPKRMTFSVLRHPLQRAHDVFVEQVLLGKRVNVRDFIERSCGLELPREEAELNNWPLTAHRSAFLGYLDFVKANLNGQTSLQIRAIWASQARLIEAITSQCPLHRLLREEDLVRDLPALGQGLGLAFPDYDPSRKPRAKLELATIYDTDLERACRKAYIRDYELLGFADWSGE